MIPADRLVLGTMNLGKRTGEPEARRIVERALDHGITRFDTADAYVDGESERILGRALGAARDRVEVATKVGFWRIEGKSEGLSARRVAAAIDESLGRLGTDRVDLYYLHVPDRGTPLEETLGAIAALLESGKIVRWGVSNYASWSVLEMIHIADARGMPRPVIGQMIHNLFVRQIEIEYLEFARKYGLETMAYNALAAGMLAGKHARGPVPEGSRFHKNPLYQRRYWTDTNFDLVDAYKNVAEGAGLTLLELAYAWLASREGESILLGPGDVAQLDVAVRALREVELSPETLARIDEIHLRHQGTDLRYAR